MDRKLPVISLLSLAIAAALSGCGGSDNSQYTSSTKSLSIKAIDGYLQYADVWLDLDGDNIQDSNEPSAVSDGTGSASLDVSRIANPTRYRVLVKATAGKTIDLDTGTTVTNSFAMIAPAPSTSGTTVVSPLTTLVAQYMESHGLSSTEAQAKVAEDLDLPQDKLMSDYIQESDPATKKTLQIFASNLAASVLPESFDGDAAKDLLSDSQSLGDLLNQYLAANPEVLTNTELKPTDIQLKPDSGSNSPVIIVDSNHDGIDDNDLDSDGIANSQDAFPQDATRAVADTTEQVEEVYTYLEDHSDKSLSLKKVATIVTSTYLDGHKVINETGTNYYWDKDKNSYEELNGKPLIYNEYKQTSTMQADGQFVNTNWWHKDLDKDGLFKFTGQSIEYGTSNDYWVLYDEDSSKDEGVVMNPLRYYDGSDLITMLKNNDFSTVDMIHHRYSTSTGNKKVNTLYQISAPKDGSSPSTPAASDWFNATTMMPNTASSTDAPYIQIDTYLTRGDGCKSHTKEADWYADGKINRTTTLVECTDGSKEEYYARPVWANPQDEFFEEYADYNFNVSGLTSYWYENSIKTKKVDGKKVITSSGERYLLDQTLLADGVNTINIRLIDADHPNGYKFNDYNSTLTNVSTTESIEYASWHHYHLDGKEFTVSSDDMGQDLKINLKEANDLWVGHRFAEWGSMNVTDLAGKIAALRAQGVTVDQINSSNLPGLDNYNGLLLNASFRYNADGTPRTWYFVTKLPALTKDNTWATWKTVPLQLVNNGLHDYGLDNWIINDAGGNLFMLEPKVDEPYGWYTAYQIWSLNVWTPDGYTIDPVAGRFDTWAGSFFLNETVANSYLATK